MKAFFLSVVILLQSGETAAQILTITDASTGLPLEQVSVYVRDIRRQAFTNREGQLDLSELPGATLFDISRVGYKNRELSRSELSAAGFQLALEPTRLTLDQVVISASRWRQERTDVPNRVVTVTPEQIQLAQPQTAADLLSLSGQLYVQKSQQAGGSPMIRGFSTNRLLYAVDGVRMNSAIFRSGNLQNVLSLDPFVMEQTEILFGPGSTLYGSDAIGGVMSFQTLTPVFSLSDDLEVRQDVTVRFSSAAREKTAHAHAMLSWKNFASVTSVSQWSFDDLRMGSHGPDEYLRPEFVQRTGGKDSTFRNPNSRVQRPTAYDQINLMQKFRYRLSEETELQFGSQYSATTNYSRYDRLTRLRNGQLRSGEFGYGPQVWWMNNLALISRKKNGFFDDAAVRLSHQLFEESRFDRDRNDAIRRNRAEKVIAFAVNADFRRVLNVRNSFFYGAEAVFNDVRSRGIDHNIETGTSTIAASRYPRAKWYSYAAYVNWQHHLSDALTATLGARVNSFGVEADFSANQPFYNLPFSRTTIQKTALTGSAGIVYHPDRTWTLSATASTGFRAPNVDDLGKIFDSTPGSVVVPNPDLEAEYAWNLETGIAKQVGDFLKLDFSAFYTKLNNAMVRRPFLLNGLDSILYNGERSRVEAIQNAAFARVYGVQGGLELQFHYGWSATVTGAWQNGIEELDNGQRDPLRHAAPLSIGSSLQYRRAKTRFQFQHVYTAAVTFADLPEEERAKTWLYARDADGNPYSPAWNVWNLRVMTQLNASWTLTAAVENLADLRYRPYSSGLSAPGRNIVFSVRAAL